MKKLLLFAAAMFTAVTMFAQTLVTITPSDLSVVTNTEVSVVKDGVSLVISTGSVTNDQIRCFKNQTLTLSVESGKITKVVITATANGTAQYGPGCFTAEGYVAGEENTGEWTGNESSVVLTASTNQVRMTEIAITVEGGAPIVKYAVSVAEATNGSIQADVQEASAGSTVNLTVLPDAGYELDKLTAKVGEEVTDLTGDVVANKLAYTMPAAAVEFAATFKVKTVAPVQDGVVVIEPADLEVVANKEINAEKGGVSLVISTGSVTNEQIRCFKNQSLTLSVESGKITKVVITAAANGSAQYGPGCFTAEGYVAGEENTGEWTGSASEVVLTATLNQVRITKIEVTVATGTATAIEDTQVRVLDINAPMYNVMGQQVNAEYKGVVIQNGQKYILR